MPPIQDENKLYNLTVNIPSLSLSALEKDAIRYSEEAKNVDAVLVIDRSGSMSGEKISSAKSAAKFFVDSMKQGDKIGVVSFSDDVRVDYLLSSIILNSRLKPNT